MQRLPFFLHKPGLMLLIGLMGGLLSDVAQASTGLDVNLTASIVNSTCKLTLENGGEVYLPNVTRAWFYNDDGSSRYSPTDEAGGTPFNVRLEDCGNRNDIQQITFSFTPQSGFWGNQNQVFKNDATAGAAQNVGIVIFSADKKTNVLNSDGSSNVVYDVSGKSSAQYLTDYPFYVRYQNTGDVVSGIVTSNVLVDVSYE